MRFVAEDPFWALFPDAAIGLVVATGIDNARGADEAVALLTAAGRQTVTRLGAAELAAHPAVAPWRESYRTFGAKPSKTRSSIENLLRLALGERGVRSINPLVDLYNAISLRHLLPCGGEDLAAVAGDLRLTRADGGEAFVPLGGGEPQPPPPGEVVYRDDLGIVCRAWNWREADRTKLTAATTDAVLVIERVPPLDPASLALACSDLASSVTRILGGSARVASVDRVHPVAELTA